MNRRTFLCGLTLGTLSAPLAAGAQQPGKVHRIGSLVPGTAAAAAPLVTAFRQGLGERGHVEGKNVAFEFRYGETAELLAQHADELTCLNLDVIVVTTSARRRPRYDALDGYGATKARRAPRFG